MTAEGRILAATLPDIPRWVKTRGMLLDHPCRVVKDDRGWIAWATNEMFVSVVGKPSPKMIRKVRSDLPRNSEFLCQEKDADHLAAALPGYERDPEIIHTLDPDAADLSAADRGVVRILEPGEESLLESLTPEWRGEMGCALRTSFVAMSFQDGRPVSFCGSAYGTEGYFDIAIVTLSDARRKGMAEACGAHLIRKMQGDGRQPVWGTSEKNAPSLGLAAKLGFRPMDRVMFFLPPVTPG
jgi:hypothetical protein